MTRRAWGSSLVALLFLALSALPGSASAFSSSHTSVSSATVATRTATMSTAARYRDEITRYINLRRQKVGCKTLIPNYYLFNAAYKHNNRMMAAHNLSHQLSGEASLGVRATQAGYTRWRMLGENLAYGMSSPWETYKAWWYSKPHRTNIENCLFKDIGLSVGFKNGRMWVTADFGRRG